ncbi:MAG: peptidylprolyl isomerase [Candidatus Omnitrophica bacterium]|nr:peptidylprolyl isomerase [Candidatus Omnitrophota bacterium]MCB9747520.1 peptidylprolyl isomerase [Candidatus Omnitrophota bacterium]
MKIENNKVVSIHYTLKNDQGEVLDTSNGNNPLGYIQGIGNIIPGLEKALEGKIVGDKVNAVIPPEEAYGKKDERLIQPVPISQFPKKEEVQVGVQFQMQSPQGVRIATVAKVEGENVVLDLNHPLADVTLHFDVEIVEVRDATEEELSHGHVHGPHGHEH